MSEQKSQVIAHLHCEIPIGGNGGSVSASSGTVDLGEVESEGSSVRETIPIYEGQAFRIGRARANDLVIENGSVSRFHAVFSGSSSGVVLSDLSSLNGTQVNGRRISTPVDVSSGDVISIGNIKITIDLTRGETAAEAAADEEDTLVSTHTAKMKSVMITVLVADVVGFTRMSQAVPPHEIAEMLNSWFRCAVGAVQSEGGEVDKYIGDCVMALWKAPGSAPESSAVKAIAAAEKILRDTAKLAESGAWQYEAKFPWRCRVALNTGEALMGAVGTGGTRDFTVLGDTVNVAFRLESLASSEGSSLVISETTADLVQHLVPLKSLGEVILEGRANNMEIFTVER